MGKPDNVQIRVAGDEVAAAGAPSGGELVAAVRRAVSLRCVLVLLVSACVLLPAVFWLPIFRRSHRSVFVPDDPYCLSADIQASFVLEKPMSLLSVNVKRLEYDLLGEIGVPNSKVAIISMQPLAFENSTRVIFGVLPDPHNTSISAPAISVLRSSLIDLVLQQLNLSLTLSIFGFPSSFELLKFPGGVTIIPVQSASIWETTQSLFQFTLNNSIKQILDNIDQLKEELKIGLNLRSYENVYVDATNTNGSTVATPVIIQASVLSDVGNTNLLPDRLKQLAQLINGSSDHNLGLNHYVFGKVKEVHLSSYLEHSISSLAPSPSPSPSPSIAPSPSPVAFVPLSSLPSPPPNHGSLNPIHSPNSLAPSNSHHGCTHCSSCHTLSPSGSRSAHLPPHEKMPKPPSPGPVGQKDHFPSIISPPPVNVPNDHPLSPTYVTHLPQMHKPSNGISMGPTPAAAPVYSLSPPVGNCASPSESNRRDCKFGSPRKKVMAPTPAAAPVHSALSPAVSFSFSPTSGYRRGSASIPPVYASSPKSSSSLSKANVHSCQATLLFGLLGLPVLLVLIGTY